MGLAVGALAAFDGRALELRSIAAIQATLILDRQLAVLRGRRRGTAAADAIAETEGRGALALFVELIADGRGRIRARSPQASLRAPLALHEIGGTVRRAAGVGRQFDRLDRRLRAGLLIRVL